MSNRQDDALAALVDRLETRRTMSQYVVSADLYEDMAKDREEAARAIVLLQARLDAAEKDAARWRFMADTKRLYLGPVIGDRNGAGVRYIIAATCLGYVPKTVETIDAAVDAEMARKR